MSSVVLCTVSRGGEIESVHRGSLVVVQDGRVTHAFGDPGALVYARSAVKPLQALPMVEEGLATALGDAELALACASHTGRPEHVATAERILAAAGLGAEALLCGPHAPGDSEAHAALIRRGEAPSRLHNNCSGKHAGFLLLAQAHGIPAAAYLDPEGALQRRVKAAVTAMMGLDSVPTALDGCGAPTFRIPLVALARGFARLGKPLDVDSARAQACERLLLAASRAPEMVAGPGKLVTALLSAGRGQLFAKNGAEGVFAVGTTRGLGIAMKVDDGADRAFAPVIVDALQRLGVLDDLSAELEGYVRPELRNTQDRLVGHVTSVVPWDHKRSLGS